VREKILKKGKFKEEEEGDREKTPGGK